MYSSSGRPSTYSRTKYGSRPARGPAPAQRAVPGGGRAGRGPPEGAGGGGKTGRGGWGGGPPPSCPAVGPRRPQLLEEEGAGGPPVAAHGAGRHAELGADLLLRHPAEEAQLDHPRE